MKSHSFSIYVYVYSRQAGHKRNGRPMSMSIGADG